MVWWNPFSWGTTIKNFTFETFEKMFLSIIGIILHEISSIIGVIIGIGMSLTQSVISSIVDTASALGPFGLPVFTIGVISVIGGLFTIFRVLHDTPIVGDLV